MSVGKRSNTTDPLTEHDVAERLDKAAFRLAWIMTDARELGLMDDVKTSRYLGAGLLEGLAAELQAWGVQPEPFRDEEGRR